MKNLDKTISLRNLRTAACPAVPRHNQPVFSGTANNLISDRRLTPEAGRTAANVIRLIVINSDGNDIASGFNKTGDVVLIDKTAVRPVMSSWTESNQAIVDEKLI